jgi:hypothetical protein
MREVKDFHAGSGIMETAAIGQAGETDRTAMVSEVKKLLELQGELIVELIDSARVPGPSDTSSVMGMGSRIDIHI